jgi:hypothetical protein
MFLDSSFFPFIFSQDFLLTIFSLEYLFSNKNKNANEISLVFFLYQICEFYDFYVGLVCLNGNCDDF